MLLSRKAHSKAATPTTIRRRTPIQTTAAIMAATRATTAVATPIVAKIMVVFQVIPATTPILVAIRATTPAATLIVAARTPTAPIPIRQRARAVAKRTVKKFLSIAFSRAHY